MFWPQSLWEWVIIFGIVWFVIVAYRHYKKEHKEEHLAEPLFHIGKKTYEYTKTTIITTKDSHNILHRFARRIILGKHRRPKNWPQKDVIENT